MLQRPGNTSVSPLSLQSKDEVSWRGGQKWGELDVPLLQTRKQKCKESKGELPLRPPPSLGALFL